MQFTLHRIIHVASKSCKTFEGVSAHCPFKRLFNSPKIKFSLAEQWTTVERLHFGIIGTMTCRLQSGSNKNLYSLMIPKSMNIL